MKLSILSVLALASCLTVFGQLGQPPCYLNGESIDLNKVYIYPGSVKSLHIEKNTPPGMDSGAELYLIAKTPLTWLHMADVQQECMETGRCSSDVLFAINGKVLADTTGVKIDDRFFVYARVLQAQQADYLPAYYKNLTVIDVFLERKERGPKTLTQGEQWINPTVRLR